MTPERKTPDLPEAAWSQSHERTLEQLSVDPQDGLTDEDVYRRRQRFGRNALEQKKKRSLWAILVDQFQSLVIGILAVAAATAFAFSQWVEGIAVSAAILLNALIGFVTEAKAVRSMDALRRLSRVSARVRRNAKTKEVGAEELVPGDIALLEAGDMVPADLRIVESSKLEVDESALTGESVPVPKSTKPVEAGAVLAERASMLFKGTAITRGSAKGVVVGTGGQTELGRISQMTEEAEEEITPLEKRLDQLARSLVWLSIGLAAVVAVLGWIRGRDLILMIESAVALAVAAIPEGLPIVATVALARGMLRMAKRNAVINRLASVETLGATSIICADKTGTLTQNKMTVQQLLVAEETVALDEQEGLRDERGEPREAGEGTPAFEALRAAVLCNNAELTRDSGGIGDPLEVALLEAGNQIGLRRRDLLQQTPEQLEVAFSRDVKMMATYHQTDEGLLVAVKGAPEAVLEACDSVFTREGSRDLDEPAKKRWLDAVDEMAGRGLRTLALAKKSAQSVEVAPYQDLCLLAVVGLLDPPRRDAREALEHCKKAGIRVVMVTGDQPRTARSIAEQVGLDVSDVGVIHGSDLEALSDLSDEEQRRIGEASVLARVSPKQKLDLITLHQQLGRIVAMTGDGVNDAPALKKADIGVAMGKRGTQVAAQASDMILRDDSFPTIVAAVQQGRVIFGNIRKFVMFLLSGNLSEIIIVGAGSLGSLPLPLLPLQILFLNLVLDVFPALAVGVGEGHAGIMERPPRPAKEPILNRGSWMFIIGYSILIAATVMASFFVARRWSLVSPEQLVTVSFLTLALGRLWHVLNLRDPGTRLFDNEIVRNPWIWAALGLSGALILAGVYLPGLSDALSTRPLPPVGYLLALSMSFVPTIIGQIVKAARYRASRPDADVRRS